MFDEPRRLPAACVAQIFAWLPMRDWFTLRRASRRLLEQSTTEGARPTHFAVCYDQVGLAHRHRPRALVVGYGYSGERADDECDTHVLPEMIYLEHLHLHAPIHDTAVLALLASLVRLRTLELGRNCQTGESLDFSALQALERLDLDGDQLTLGMAKTLPASLRSLVACLYDGPDQNPELDAYPFLGKLTALHLTRLENECAPCVAAIVAHMPKLVAATIHVMDTGAASEFTAQSHLAELGAVANHQLRAFATLRQLRRLTVIGNLVSRAAAPPPIPNGPPSSLALLCRMPALEHLDLAALVVHCHTYQALVTEKSEFDANAFKCRSVAAPVWRKISL